MSSRKQQIGAPHHPHQGVAVVPLTAYQMETWAVIVDGVIKATFFSKDAATRKAYQLLKKGTHQS